MSTFVVVLLVALVAGAATAWATAALIPHLTRWQFMDVPNARSSHHVPTPRGGGLAPVVVLLGVGGAWAAGAAMLSSVGPILLGAALLAVVSLRDDRRTLGVLPRLLAQGTAVGLGVLTGLMAWPLPPTMPHWLWIALPVCALGWLWFVNLFNFMDGIDGISGVALIAMGAGACAVMLAGSSGEVGFGRLIVVAGALLAAVAAGFLVQNWHPARVFLGDVGSIPLGYCAAALMLALAVAGAPAAALLLPAYHLVDATVTLARRAWRREVLTQAHRSHAYQRAVRAGLRHDQVCWRLGALNAGLIVLAVLSLSAPILALLVGYAATAALYLWLDRVGGPRPGPVGP